MGIDTFLQIHSTQLQLLMFCFIMSGWWQMTKKNGYLVIYVLLSARLRLTAWVIRCIDVKLFCYLYYFIFNDKISVIYAELLMKILVD